MLYSRVSVIRLSVVSPTRSYVLLVQSHPNTVHGVIRKIIFTCTSLSVLRPNV